MNVAQTERKSGERDEIISFSSVKFAGESAFRVIAYLSKRILSKYRLFLHHHHLKNLHFTLKTSSAVDIASLSGRLSCSSRKCNAMFHK
jgi:hypothetical protein